MVLIGLSFSHGEEGQADSTIWFPPLTVLASPPSSFLLSVFHTPRGHLSHVHLPALCSFTTFSCSADLLLHLFSSISA